MSRGSSGIDRFDGGEDTVTAHVIAVVLRIITTGLVTHVALSLALVSRYGFAGAPVALLLSSLIVAIGYAVVFHRRVAPLTPLAHAIGVAKATLAP